MSEDSIAYRARSRIGQEQNQQPNEGGKFRDKLKQLLRIAVMIQINAFKITRLIMIFPDLAIVELAQRTLVNTVLMESRFFQ